MANGTRRRSSEGRREALVFTHLERVSKDLLLRHPDVVRDWIGHNSGVYALYRKGRLSYVGLASALLDRLLTHLKNKKWDQFSIYLTIRDQHLREIEAILLRITRPPDAKNAGKLVQSKDMRRHMQAAIRRKNHVETSSLFGSLSPPARRLRSRRGESDLIRLLPNGGRLQATNKDTTFRARALKNGKIRFNGKVYSSLSLAAKAAIGRTINGWWFWQIERGRRNWVRLTRVKQDGTPIYLR